MPPAVPALTPLADPWLTEISARLVHCGNIELHIGKRKEVLSLGDCVQFESTMPHKFTAMTSEPASALVVIAAKGD
jgi:hypothetical protein